MIRLNNKIGGNKMKKYKVDVWWVSTIEVKARSQEEAKEKAIDTAESYDNARLDHTTVWEQ